MLIYDKDNIQTKYGKVVEKEWTLKKFQYKEKKHCGRCDCKQNFTGI